MITASVSVSLLFSLFIECKTGQNGWGPVSMSVNITKYVLVTDLQKDSKYTLLM